MNIEANEAETIEIAALTQLAGEVLSGRQSLEDRLTSNDPSVDDAALPRLIQMGTSAGGARAKVIIAINREGHI
ncbi:hypothetical protein GIB64_21375 [Pseudomonas lactis]|uniref:hypothetical protein n=1 Tax=Pseudomonas TaxID=286 RepID=UPI000BB5A3B4|nr:MULTISPECIES: hypothetical protein [Pseudomonas]MBA5959985.1 hypothetical protein [Pseudomonas lactis]PRW77965.1 hypothetical protein C7A12_09395 [Pseudomonas fluorescens]PRW80601.1 hypothetical protein C7A13_07825 [Pseudomonas fluorescens]